MTLYKCRFIISATASDRQLTFHAIHPALEEEPELVEVILVATDNALKTLEPELTNVTTHIASSAVAVFGQSCEGPLAALTDALGSSAHGYTALTEYS